MHSPFHPPIHSFIYPFTYPLIYPSIHPFIHQPIHQSTHQNPPTSYAAPLLDTKLTRWTSPLPALCPMTNEVTGSQNDTSGWVYDASQWKVGR